MTDHPVLVISDATPPKPDKCGQLVVLASLGECTVALTLNVN